MAKVRIIYKSGAVQDIRCKNFTVTTSGLGAISAVKWDTPKPRPLHIGVDQIAAVYVLKES